MKKTISIILFQVLIIVMLVSCGKTEPSTGSSDSKDSATNSTEPEVILLSEAFTKSERQIWFQCTDETGTGYTPGDLEYTDPGFENPHYKKDQAAQLVVGKNSVVQNIIITENGNITAYHIDSDNTCNVDLGKKYNDTHHLEEFIGLSDDEIIERAKAIDNKIQQACVEAARSSIGSFVRDEDIYSMSPVEEPTVPIDFKYKKNTDGLTPACLCIMYETVSLGQYSGSGEDYNVKLLQPTLAALFDYDRGVSFKDGDVYFNGFYSYAEETPFLVKIDNEPVSYSPDKTPPEICSDTDATMDEFLARNYINGVFIPYEECEARWG